MTPDDEILLSEFRKALRISSKEKVVDFDNSFNKKFDFQAHRFEDVLRNTNRNIPPNRWSYHRIGLIKKGAGEFITGLYKFTATKNTLVVIPQRVVTSSKNWTVDMEGYILLFNSEFFLQNNFPRQLIDNKKILVSSIQPFIRLNDEDAAGLADIFETILELNKDKTAGNTELVTLKTLELVINCERLFDEQLHFDEDIPRLDIIQKYSNLVEEYFIKERGISFYATQLNVHPNYLNSLIKTHTGKTAKELLQNRLLLEIKYLLHSTDSSVKEIATQLGFNDANYFTSFFSRSEKLSPTKYRSSFL